MMRASRRFAMLLWIDIKRCQGVFVAPIVAIAVIWLYRDYYERDGLVIWRDVSNLVVDTGFIFGAAGAGFAVWATSRVRRRGIGSYMESMPVPRGHAELLTMVAVSLWMLLAAGTFFAWHAVPAMREATWGGPEPAYLLMTVFTIVIGVAFGTVVSALGHSAILAPLSAIGFLAINVYVAEALNIGRDWRLVPLKLANDYDYGLRYPIPQAVMWSAVAWLAAAALAVALIALVVRQRTVVRQVGLALSVVLVVITVRQAGAEQDKLISREGWATFEQQHVTPVCEQAQVVEICLHPAHTTLMDDYIATADSIYGRFAGIDALPDRLLDSSIDRAVFGTETSVVISIYSADTVKFDVARSLEFILNDSYERHGLLTASQCVVIVSMVPGGLPHHCVFGNVVEQPTAGPGANDAFDPELQGRMEAKIESFRAMSEEQQHAWLVTNWNALRAGEIGLDEMP